MNGKSNTDFSYRFVTEERLDPATKECVGLFHTHRLERWERDEEEEDEEEGAGGDEGEVGGGGERRRGTAASEHYGIQVDKETFMSLLWKTPCFRLKISVGRCHFLASLHHQEGQGAGDKAKGRRRKGGR